MKMEFLDASGGGEYPSASPKSLIRLSEFSDEEKVNLIRSIEGALLGENQILRLHKLPFIEPNNCFVNLTIGEENEGLVETGSKNEYTCFLSPAAYQDMIDIIRNVEDGHYWLTPGEYLDEPAFLISKLGPW